MYRQFGREQKLEFSVDLKGGSVDWASKDKSSKKHVLEVSDLEFRRMFNNVCEPRTLLWSTQIVTYLTLKVCCFGI